MSKEITHQLSCADPLCASKKLQLLFLEEVEGNLSIHLRCEACGLISTADFEISKKNNKQSIVEKETKPTNGMIG